MYKRASADDLSLMTQLYLPYLTHDGTQYHRICGRFRDATRLQWTRSP